MTMSILLAVMSVLSVVAAILNHWDLNRPPVEVMTPQKIEAAKPAPEPGPEQYLTADDKRHLAYWESVAQGAPDVSQLIVLTSGNQLIESTEGDPQGGPHDEPPTREADLGPETDEEVHR